jgi:DNA repair exonuclease SbcCD ATPase subunit
MSAIQGSFSKCSTQRNKAARVTIRGSMNEISFAISRGKSSSKGSLTFVYDDEDLTRQSVKETQVLIEEKLGVGSQILSRTVFHGQHAMNGLLEATDAKLKDELGSIVALSVWQQAAQKARSKTRSYSKQLSELDGMLSIRQKDLDILSEKSLDAGRIVREMEQTLEDQRGGDQADIKVQLHKASHNPNMESLQMELNVYTEQVRSLENGLDKTQVACEQALKEMRNHAMEKKSEYDNARSKRLLIQQQIKRLENDLTSANKHLDSLNGKWQTEHTNMEHSTELLVIEECPTCGQSINDEHSLKNVRLEITDSINSAVRNVEDIAGSLSIEKRNAEIDASKFHQLELELSDLSDILKVNERDWEMQISDIRHQIFEERRKHSKCLTALAEAAKVMEGRMERAKYDANLSLKIKRFEDKIEAARESQRALSCDVTEMENTLNDLAVKRGDIERQCALMTSVSDNFGVRGVQTYILQNAVHALRVASQCYLDELSDGSLHLSLDLDSNDRILRTASVRTPNGSLSRRPLSSLSG